MPSQQFKKLLEEKPDMIDEVCRHVANGGSIIDLCELWKVSFGDMHIWLDEKKRNKKYLRSIIAQDEWAIQRILKELRDISYFNGDELYNEDHTLKPVSEWPKGAIQALKSIQVDELFEGTGKDRTKIGVSKKVKLIDKIKSIELMMKNLGILTDRSMILKGTTNDEDFCDEFFGVKDKDEKKEEY